MCLTTRLHSLSAQWITTHGQQSDVERFQKGREERATLLPPAPVPAPADAAAPAKAAGATEKEEVLV